MINYFENGFAVPLILGDNDESISAARLIKRKTTLQVTVLSERLSFVNKIRFQHLRLRSTRYDILLLALRDFAKSQHEYSTPLLIYSEEMEDTFICKYHSALESLYVLIPTKDLKTYFEGV